MENLPINLSELYLDRNSLILDRMAINALLSLHKLTILTIEGNICPKEMECLLLNKLGETFHILKENEEF